MFLNRNGSLVISGPHLRLDVQVRYIFRESDIAYARCNKLTGSLPGFIVHALKDLQHLVSLAAHDTEHRRGLNSLLTAGIGHCHALDILDHISGTADRNVLRHLSQLLIGFGCGVRDGDRLCTAHCSYELLFQDGCIILR